MANEIPQATGQLRDTEYVDALNGSLPTQRTGSTLRRLSHVVESLAKPMLPGEIGEVVEAYRMAAIPNQMNTIIE